MKTTIGLFQHLEVVQTVLKLKSYRAEKLLDGKTHFTAKSNPSPEVCRIKNSVGFPSFRDVLRLYKQF